MSFSLFLFPFFSHHPRLKFFFSWTRDILRHYETLATSSLTKEKEWWGKRKGYKKEYFICWSLFFQTLLKWKCCFSVVNFLFFHFPFPFKMIMKILKIFKNFYHLMSFSLKISHFWYTDENKLMSKFDLKIEIWSLRNWKSIHKCLRF